MFAAPLPRPVTRSIMTSSPDITFHDGRSIPQLGYGVWQVENDVAADVVTQAVEAGFRHIDTARGYNNEEGVGRALKQLDIARDDLFITSKVPNQRSEEHTSELQSRGQLVCRPQLVNK